jgi:hypothetical protein
MSLTPEIGPIIFEVQGKVHSATEQRRTPLGVVCRTTWGIEPGFPLALEGRRPVSSSLTRNWEGKGLPMSQSWMKGGSTYRLGVWFRCDEMLNNSVTDQTNNHRRGWSE